MTIRQSAVLLSRSGDRTIGQNTPPSGLRFPRSSVGFRNLRKELTCSSAGLSERVSAKYRPAYLDEMTRRVSNHKNLFLFSVYDYETQSV
jgi:hypothetical protein